MLGGRDFEHRAGLGLPAGRELRGLGGLPETAEDTVLQGDGVGLPAAFGQLVLGYGEGIEQFVSDEKGGLGWQGLQGEVPGGWHALQGLLLDFAEGR